MTERSQNFCPSCGTQVQGDARFCSNCGQVLGEDAPPPIPQPDSIQTESVPVPPIPDTQTSGGGGSGRVVRNVLIGCGGLVVIVFLLLFILILIIPSDDTTGEGGSEDTQPADSGGAGSGETFTNENYGDLIADPDAGEGASVNVTGQLLGAPEEAGGELAFQMFADPANYEQNTIVYYGDTDADVQADDYVRVQGEASGTFSGENYFGTSLDAPLIEAESVEVISAAEAVDPTIKTLEVNQTSEDKGFSMTLQRIEFGERTTRAYVSITNNTQDQASFYTYGSTVVQGSNQTDVDDSFLYELKEPQSEISRGVTTEGAVVFGPVNPDEPMRFQFEWSSYDFNITPGPVTFDVAP